MKILQTVCCASLQFHPIIEHLSKPERTLQRHNTENSKHIFPDKELCGLSPNFHIHVSVSDIPTVYLSILLQENMWTDPGIAHTHMNVEIGTEARAIPFLGIHKWDFRCSVLGF